jgi:hypothetical protein
MTVPAPSTCPECGGTGAVGDVTQSWCASCRCVACGEPCLTGLCRACDQDDLDARDRRREMAR